MGGCGGTGKSRVIQTISEEFERRHVGVWLLKAAYTGIAASLVDGKTLHFIGKISFDQNGKAEVDPKTKAKLQQFWRYYRYLIIDEYSMISKVFLAKLSKHIAIAKSADDPSAINQSFGGINVIFAGDLHQFPPVANTINCALFVPPSPTRDSKLAQIGASIYREFTSVVILREQKRVIDPVWMDFLQALRVGQVQRSHLGMLRELILQPSTSDSNTSWSATLSSIPGDNPWLDAPLVTPRHCVRTAWNAEALRRHCQKTGQRLFICPSEDTIGGKPLSSTEKQFFEARQAQRSRRHRGGYQKDLPNEIQLAMGAKVLVTQNLQTDLDVANGARGKIVGLLFHPDEPPPPSESVVRLKYTPCAVLVKLERTRAQTLPGLEPGVIPVEPVAQKISFEIPNPEPGHKPLKRTVTRRQFPMTCAWAFTDYRSQGQTLIYVIIDITRPPTGTMSLFNLYVALSRSRGRDNIRLLRDFDDAMFLKPQNPDLLAEDDRLEALARKTKEEWAFVNTF